MSPCIPPQTPSTLAATAFINHRRDLPQHHLSDLCLEIGIVGVIITTTFSTQQAVAATLGVPRNRTVCKSKRVGKCV